MKKLLTLMALLLVIPFTAALTQKEADERVNDIISSVSDYQSLIQQNNKLEYVKGLLNTHDTSKVFRAIFHSDGFKAYLKLNSGRTFAHVKKGPDYPPHVVVCGDSHLDKDEECDDGNTTDGDGCSSSCTIEP